MRINPACQLFSAEIIRCLYAALILSALFFTEGFSKYVLERSSFNTPVFSNFFLNLFKALSIDSFSFTFTIIIVY